MAEKEELEHVIPNCAAAGYFEFNELLDFVWKSPRFIDVERKREINKITFDLPDSASEGEKEAAALYKAYRFHREVKKVIHSFPKFLNSANLFIAASLYEHHLINICMHLEYFSDKKLSDMGGQGLSRLYRYLKYNNIDRSLAPHYTECESAISIRNCLMHAGGLIEWSRDKGKIYQIIKNDLHLTEYTRSYIREKGERFASLTARETASGPRLIVPDEYPHIAAGVLRDHMVGVARLVELQACTSNPIADEGLK